VFSPVLPSNALSEMYRVFGDVEEWPALSATVYSTSVGLPLYTSRKKLVIGFANVIVKGFWYVAPAKFAVSYKEEVSAGKFTILVTMAPPEKVTKPSTVLTETVDDVAG
jgi:hypothetical protein